jgi:hypothetical protein
MAFTKVRNSMLAQPVNHNILINPSFTVKQRGDVIDHNDDSYGPDRWIVRGVTGTKGTMSQSSTVIDATTGTNKLVVKHRNATSNAYTVQKIEAVNLLGLYGKEITFSFSYSDTGGSGVPIARIASFDSTFTYKTILEAVPTSLGNNRWSCTVTLTTEDGTFPDPSERGMQVNIYPNEMNAAPAEWSVWETKLEVGSVATPFIARSYGEELALCQRYYQELSSGRLMSVGNGQGYSNGGAGLSVQLRAAATVGWVYGNGSDFAGFTGMSGTQLTSSCTINSSVTKEAQLRYNINNSDDLYVYWHDLGTESGSLVVKIDAEL